MGYLVCPFPAFADGRVDLHVEDEDEDEGDVERAARGEDDEWGHRRQFALVALKKENIEIFITIYSKIGSNDY